MAHRFLGLLASSLSILMVVSPLLNGQNSSIQIRVLSGEDGINNISKNVAAEMVVEVIDATGKPVPDARVTLRSPATGPSVIFFGASRTTTMSTDEMGRIRVDGVLPNTEVGAFQIDVEAEYNSMTAAAVISQSNGVAASEQKSKRTIGWRLIVALATAAVIAVVAATLRGR